MAHGVGDSPKRMGIGEALDGLENRVSESHKLAESLELRLSGLLRQDAPAAESGGETQARRNGAPMTNHAETIADRVAVLNDRLRDLLDRLDI